MKTAVISDIHVDINREYPVVDCLASYVKEQHADLLLVAGDLSEHVDETIETAALLEQKSGCRVFYVPGNHDMWSEDFDKAGTDSIYQRYLEDPRCLSGSIQLLRGINGPFALIGDIGWYDYSFSNAFYPEEELEKMTHDGRTWQDKLKNQWTADNKERSRIQLTGLEKQLKDASERGVPIIAMTHMLPIPEFCVPTEREMWKYFNAFLGTGALGQLFERYQVSYSICGHVHYRKQAVHGQTRYLCACLGYHTEWPVYAAAAPGGRTELDWQIENTVQWIDW